MTNGVEDSSPHPGKRCAELNPVGNTKPILTCFSAVLIQIDKLLTGFKKWTIYRHKPDLPARDNRMKLPVNTPNRDDRTPGFHPVPCWFAVPVSFTLPLGAARGRSFSSTGRGQRTIRVADDLQVQVTPVDPSLS
jgi:hypothetical protein